METIKFHFKAMKSIIQNWFKKKIYKKKIFDVNFRVMKLYTSNIQQTFKYFLKDSFKISSVL